MITLENKKGALIGPINSLIVTTIVVALILIVAFLLISFIGTPSADVTYNSLAKSSAMTSMKAYLETPVKAPIDGKAADMRMIELIRLAHVNQSYMPLLQSETDAIFAKAFPDGSIKISFSGDQENVFKEKMDLPGGIAIYLYSPKNAPVVYQKQK